MKIQPVHCRAARAALDWSQEKLAAEANVSASTIKNFEAVRRIPHQNRLNNIVAALANAGVEFIEAEEGGAGPGIRLTAGTDPDKRIVEEREAEEAEEAAANVEKMTPEELSGFRAYWTEERLAKLSESGRDRLRGVMEGKVADDGDETELAAE